MPLKCSHTFSPRLYYIGSWWIQNANKALCSQTTMISLSANHHTSEPKNLKNDTIDKIILIKQDKKNITKLSSVTSFTWRNHKHSFTGRQKNEGEWESWPRGPLKKVKNVAFVLVFLFCSRFTNPFASGIAWSYAHSTRAISSGYESQTS